MKLSVVIPTLNRLESLKITLIHLLPQIQRNINFVEFFISVNKSDDYTEDYIKNLSFNNPFIKYRIFNSRVDICESFSRSIELCSGDYVMIFGDDDIPAPYMIESILEVLNKHNDAALFHFNRLVGSNVNQILMNRIRSEEKLYTAEIQVFNIDCFIEKFTISPGFISSMVFWRDAWNNGNYIDVSNHYGYEFLSRIYAGIHKLENYKCVYHSHPLVVQRLINTREWNDQWPKYWLLGVPNLLSGLDEAGITNNAVVSWRKILNKSFLKFLYTLLWASMYKKVYKPLVPEIQRNQKNFFRKICVIFVIYFTPNFVFKLIRSVLYK